MPEAISINAAPPAPESGAPANVSDGSVPNSAVAKPPIPGSETAPKAPAAPATQAAPAEPKQGESFVPKIEEPPKEAPKIDLSSAVAEFGKDGKVSEATYKAAEAKGMTRADVDIYVAGAKSRVESVANALSDIAGGQDNLRSIMQWAGANVDAHTREAFNTAMDKADSTAASLMLRGLIAQYNDAVGVEGQRVIGAGPGRGVAAFDNWNQVAAAMATKEYKNDPAFRAKVEARIAVSKL